MRGDTGQEGRPIEDEQARRSGGANGRHAGLVAQQRYLSDALADSPPRQRPAVGDHIERALVDDVEVRADVALADDLGSVPPLGSHLRKPQAERHQAANHADSGENDRQPGRPASGYHKYADGRRAPNALVAIMATCPVAADERAPG